MGKHEPVILSALAGITVAVSCYHSKVSVYFGVASYVFCMYLAILVERLKEK